MDEREFTRRGLLRTGATVAAVGTVGSSVAAAESSGDGVRPIPPVDLSGVQLDTTPVDGVPEPATGVRPGSQIVIDSPSFDRRGCTANFVWKDRRSGTHYLGTAGHCLLPEDEAATTNAGGRFNPKDVTVEVFVDGVFGGASSAVLGGRTVKLGEVAYARQSRGDGNGIGNDFGLVEIPGNIDFDPSLPTFGGPTGEDRVELGDQLCLVGAGDGTGEVFATQSRTGVGLEGEGWEWEAELAAAIGDSGAPVQQCVPGPDGLSGEEAIGVLTHFGTAPPRIAGTTMRRARALAREAGLFIDLVTP